MEWRLYSGYIQQACESSICWPPSLTNIEGPAMRWRICDKLIVNGGKFAIRIPSHTIAIAIRKLLGFPVVTWPKPMRLSKWCRIGGSISGQTVIRNRAWGLRSQSDSTSRYSQVNSARFHSIITSHALASYIWLFLPLRWWLLPNWLK